MITMPLSFMWNGNGCGTAIVLPGMQSTSYGAALGLRPVLEEHYKWIIGYDYNLLPSWRPERYAAEFADIAAYWQRNTNSVALLGFSVGAPLSVLTTDAMRKLRDAQKEEGKLDEKRLASVERSNYRVIMVDPPFGRRSMIKVTEFHLNHAALAVLGAITPSSFDAQLVTGKPEVPNDGQLWLPTPGDRAGMFHAPGLTEEQYLQLARSADVSNQKGYPLKTWFKQPAWLTGKARKLPFDAMAGVRADLITAKSELNTVVRSELAEPEWLRRMWFDNVLNVNAEHCATLRHQPTYAAAFRELLNN